VQILWMLDQAEGEGQAQEEIIRDYFFIFVPTHVFIAVMAYCIVMLRAVTNRDFPMLRQTLRSLFDMELDYDPSLNLEGRSAIWRFIHTHFSSDPEGRVRIIFVDTEDLSYGRARHVDVTGFNIPYQRLILIGVPESIETQSEECYKTCTMDSYLLVINLHEFYELFTSDFSHCGNPGRCINSECGIYEVGTCSACMGALVDEKFPDLKLEDLYCEAHLAKLKAALMKWNGF
jgi:hypothetical protein